MDPEVMTAVKAGLPSDGPPLFAILVIIGILVMDIFLPQRSLKHANYDSKKLKIVWIFHKI